MSKNYGLIFSAIALVSGAASTTAVASAMVSVPPKAVAPATPEAIVRQALLKFVPDVAVDSITPAPMPGFYQVIASGHLVYISSDGKYMMNGDLIDLNRGEKISDDAWATFRKAELAKVPAASRIVFAPAHPKYTVTVFTDVTCPYCRALHEQVAAYNKEGIAVEYLAWPREGVTTQGGRPTKTYTEMVSVWCAADRKDALTAAQADTGPKPATCANPVKDQFDLGIRLGITGTPAVYAEDGTMIGGYLSPEDMLKAVQDHSSVGG
jgi:thiol:disulfide interchange protein DsbC